MIAIIIFTHKNLVQTKRLIKTLKNDKVDIFLHIDKKCKEQINIDNVFFLKRHDIKWGGESQVEAVFDSLNEILSLDRNYDHYIFMSGQDYLIKPISRIVDFLEDKKDKSFIEYRKLTKNDINIQNRYLEYHTNSRYLDAILRRVMPKRKLFNNMNVYFGGCWWILTNETVKYMVKEYFDKYHKKLKMTVCIDEIIYQTILLNSNFKNSIVNDSMRYVDWSDHKKGLNNGNPNILKTNDYKKIVDSGKIIARKFDIKVDKNILDMLDKYRGEI